MFKTGDTVWLTWGGPAMTVDAVYAGSREARCSWTSSDGGTVTRLNDVYHWESLTLNEPTAQPTSPAPVAGTDGVYEEGDD